MSFSSFKEMGKSILGLDKSPSISKLKTGTLNILNDLKEFKLKLKAIENSKPKGQDPEFDKKIAAASKSFDKMKKNPSFSTFDEIFIQESNQEKFSFFRKGQIGNWVEHFSEENSKKIDAIIETKLHKDIQYQFFQSK